jgi:hypothetical protein
VTPVVSGENLTVTSRIIPHIPKQAVYTRKSG